MVSQNVVNVYGVVWGNCTHALQTKIQSNSKYMDKSANSNYSWLREQIRLVKAEIDKRQDITFNTFKAAHSVCSIK